jgi:hypothetical protein
MQDAGRMHAGRRMQDAGRRTYLAKAITCSFKLTLLLPGAADSPETLEVSDIVD